MNTFETLIFVPEGTLLNEKLAIKNALRKTLKYFDRSFGSSESIKYTKLSESFKLLDRKEQINLLLQNFFYDELNEAERVFNQDLQKQHRLIKDSAEFLNKIQDKFTLVCVGKESKSQLLPRLNDSGIVDKFNALFFADDFDKILPDKSVFINVVKDLGVDPDNSLIIGSTLSEEIQGAENSGLKSLWLAPKKEKIPIVPHPTLHLSRLSDLAFYLNIE